MKKLLGIVVLGFILIGPSFAADKKNLTKKETIKFLDKYAITIEDERSDGVVTYIFYDRNYKRFKDFKVISEDAWRFSKLGALRLFNKDIKITWKIKLGKIMGWDYITEQSEGSAYDYTCEGKKIELKQDWESKVYKNHFLEFEQRSDFNSPWKPSGFELSYLISPL